MWVARSYMDYNRSVSIKSNKMSHKGQTFKEKMVTLLQFSIAIRRGSDISNIKIWVNKGFDRKRAIVISCSVIGSILAVIIIVVLICCKDRLTCHCKCPKRKDEYNEVPQREVDDSTPNKNVKQLDSPTDPYMVNNTYINKQDDIPIPKPGTNLYPVFTSIEDIRISQFKERYPAQVYTREQMPDMKPACDICALEFIDNTTFVTLYCRHTFHYVCIYEKLKLDISLSKDLACPSCLQKINL